MTTHKLLIDASLIRMMGIIDPVHFHHCCNFILHQTLISADNQSTGSHI
jgi:hypothetical protein